MTLRSPFPYFGNKSRVASRIWEALGDVSVYVEPFAGSLAVLLARPTTPRVETVNDLDGFISNVYRALKWAPDEVAEWADWNVNEVDLHARHQWLVARRATLTAALVADPEFFDAKAAAWWCWGASCWIGSGWCDEVDSVTRKLPNIDGSGLKGCVGVARGDLRVWFRALSERLREVRVANGDWSRVVTPTVLRASGDGNRAVLFDPPYESGSQQYAAGGTGTSLSADVRRWCAEHGDDPTLRVVLCGRDAEHQELESLGWRVDSWSAKGGYGVDKEARHSERIWLSPHCEVRKQGSLF